MAQPNQVSIQESSEDSTSPNSIQVFHHVLNNVLKIIEDEVASLQNWMKYLGYNNFLDLCYDFQRELKDFHSCSGYTVQGQQCTLNFGIMNKLRIFISWVETKMKTTPVMFPYDNFLLLVHQEFHFFKQEEVSRMTPGPTKQMTPLTSHTSGSKKQQAFLSQHDGLLDEPDFESTKETLLDPR